ncbi:unnamed protein product, partial [Coregonus sp. 'balchen']
SLTEALNASVWVEQELKPHLDTVLAVLLEKKKGAAVEIASSGIVPILAQSLKKKSLLTNQVALVVAEMAREVADEELLLHTGRAIGRICFDNTAQQDQLVQSGVIPRLVAIMREYPENDPLVNVCLLALCNLADMGVIEVGVAEVLTAQLKRAPDAGERHIILEVLGSWRRVLQFVESGVPEALSEMIRGLQGGSDPHDLCSIKIASNLIVSLLLGDSNCVKMLELGVVPHILTLLEQHVDEGDVSRPACRTERSQNLAIPGEDAEDGVTERIRPCCALTLPQCQFKLLGTLRMMVDGQ